MKSEWKEYLLGDIVDMVIDYRGKTPKKLGSDWAKNGYRALSAKNIKTGKIVNESSIRFVDESLYRKWMKDEICKGDILITSEAPFGQVFLWNSDEKIVLSQRLFCVRLKHDVDPMFVYHVMAGNDFQIELDGHATGTTVTGLRQPELLKCKITLPPFPTQKKIAAILSALDAKIENNNAINRNLEQQAQALFKSWFVDFEPFGGKMPEGWRVGKAEEIIDIHDNKRIPLSNMQRAKLKKIYPYYGATTIMDYVDDYLFDGVYLLFAEDGTVITEDGYPVLQYVEGKFWVNNHAHILTGRNGFSTEMLWLMFNKMSIKSVVTGAVQPKVSQGNLKKLNVVIPGSECLSKFDILIKPFFDKMRVVKQENTRLAALRDTLLPKLMSGEIEV